MEARVSVPARADGGGRRADHHQLEGGARGAVRYQTSFARTPKYAIGSSQKVKLTNVQYRRRSGWLPYAELAVGTGFLAMIAFAVESFNYLAVPFLLLFVSGYYWAGFTTLWEEYQGKLAFERQRALAAAAEQVKA